MLKLLFKILPPLFRYYLRLGSIRQRCFVKFQRMPLFELPSSRFCNISQNHLVRQFNVYWNGPLMQVSLVTNAHQIRKTYVKAWNSNFFAATFCLSSKASLWGMVPFGRYGIGVTKAPFAFVSINEIFDFENDLLFFITCLFDGYQHSWAAVTPGKDKSYIRLKNNIMIRTKNGWK